jgi:hypothetical protein
MPKNLTIGQKLAASFGVVIVLAGLLSYSSLATVSRLGGKLKVAVNEGGCQEFGSNRRNQA